MTKINKNSGNIESEIVSLSFCLIDWIIDWLIGCLFNWLIASTLSRVLRLDPPTSRLLCFPLSSLLPPSFQSAPLSLSLSPFTLPYPPTPPHTFHSPPTLLFHPPPPPFLTPSPSSPFFPAVLSGASVPFSNFPFLIFPFSDGENLIFLALTTTGARSWIAAFQSPLRALWLRTTKNRDV